MTALFDTSQNEFLAPYSVEECSERIKELHQGVAFFAWGMTGRTTAQVKPVDATRANFALRRILNNNGIGIALHMGPFALKGNLEAQSSGTMVQYHIEPNWIMAIIWIIQEIILLLLVLLMILAGDPILIVTMLALLLFTIFQEYLVLQRVDFLKNQLIETLR